eukprot:scaffold30342_cov61-Cyclotella_meneghiniana.AAC.3
MHFKVEHPENGEGYGTAYSLKTSQSRQPTTFLPPMLPYIDYHIITSPPSTVPPQFLAMTG